MGSAKTRINYGRLIVCATPVAAALAFAVGCAVINSESGSAPHTVSVRGGQGEVAALTGDLAKNFDARMQPFLQAYCIDCHAGATPSADLNLEMKDWKGMEARSTKVLKVLTKLHNNQMPPADVKQPKPEERTFAIGWMKQFIAEETRAHAGDPGVVLAHRLSNAEYNYTIKDLTGHDMQPAKEFPIDPANQAGFDNTGESLMMDPELMKKYLEAARDVSEHLIFQSDGLAFAPFPAIADTDRDKYAVNRILDFYKKQPTDVGAYLLAAWHYENAKASGATLEAIAARENVNAKYLKKVYETLTDPNEKVGPIAGLSAWWKTLKTVDGPDAEKKFAANLADWVRALRAATRPKFANLNAPGMDPGSQFWVIWKVRQLESTHSPTHPVRH